MRLLVICLFLALGVHAVPTVFDTVSDNITKIMKAIGEKWPDNPVFKTVGAGIGAVENAAGSLLGQYSSMASDLDNGKCGDVMLIWARGVSVTILQGDITSIHSLNT